MSKKTIIAFEYLGWISLALFAFAQLFSSQQSILPIAFLIATLIFSVLSGILAMYKNDDSNLKLAIRRLFPSLCIVSFLAAWMFKVI